VKKLNPKAVIFDLGSTLIDFPVTNWEPVSRECTLAGRRLLIQHGRLIAEESQFVEGFERVRGTFRDRAAITQKEWTIVEAAQEYFNQTGVRTEDGLADKFFDAFYAELEKHLSLYDDTIEVLTRVKKKFPKVGLISNTIFPERAHYREFKRFGLKPYFDFAIFSSTFGLRKPHPSIFLEAAKASGFEPEDCVYIGDRYLEDVQGSSGAGMHPILKVIAGRDYPPNIPESIRTIHCLSDLSRHLDI
jgi:HAD superfamily hydrolase (TIGR01549 family)